MRFRDGARREQRQPADVAGGARVIMLERGPRLSSATFTQSLRLDTYTKLVDLIRGTGCDVIAANCVGGGSVIYFAASLRAPSFVFERMGTLAARLWPAAKPHLATAAGAARA